MGQQPINSQCRCRSPFLRVLTAQTLSLRRSQCQKPQLVNHLLDAGAVLFVKTNVPQTMLAFECSNPLWGRTLNPYSPLYTCGGSSGGEGALLAMDGSALGIGSDIGGSLRIPATYCGIYSFKPGYGRVSYTGGRGPVGGFEGIKTVAGPMGRSADDVTLLAKALLGKKGSNEDIPPLPFRQVELPQKLKFGYYTSGQWTRSFSSPLQLGIWVLTS